LISVRRRGCPRPVCFFEPWNDHVAVAAPVFVTAIRCVTEVPEWADKKEQKMNIKGNILFLLLYKFLV